MVFSDLHDRHCLIVGQGMVAEIANEYPLHVKFKQQQQNKVVFFRLRVVIFCTLLYVIIVSRNITLVSSRTNKFLDELPVLVDFNN